MTLLLLSVYDVLGINVSFVTEKVPLLLLYVMLYCPPSLLFAIVAPLVTSVGLITEPALIVALPLLVGFTAVETAEAAAIWDAVKLGLIAIVKAGLVVFCCTLKESEVKGAPPVAFGCIDVVGGIGIAVLVILTDTPSKLSV